MKVITLVSGGMDSVTALYQSADLFASDLLKSGGDSVTGKTIAETEFTVQLASDKNISREGGWFRGIWNRLHMMLLQF